MFRDTTMVSLEGELGHQRPIGYIPNEYPEDLSMEDIVRALVKVPGDRISLEGGSDWSRNDWKMWSDDLTWEGNLLKLYRKAFTSKEV